MFKFDAVIGLELMVLLIFYILDGLVELNGTPKCHWGGSHHYRQAGHLNFLLIWLPNLKFEH